MPKIFFILLLFLTLCQDFVKAGQEIVAVQSLKVAPYQQALDGFKRVLDRDIKIITISELKGTNLAKEINSINPDMVLAIGMGALSGVKWIKNIPIIYLMVLNPELAPADKKNITGINMNIPQEKQLTALLEVLPDTKTIGLLYDPKRTGSLVKRARDAARKIKIELMAKKINRPSQVASMLKEMRGNIDVFWMLPDITVITPETIELMLLFSLEHKIPVLTFSEKYVESGALMSISIDAFDIGIQAGEIAESILSGKKTINGRNINPRKIVPSINLTIANKLDVTIDPEVIKKSRIIK